MTKTLTLTLLSILGIIMYSCQKNYEPPVYPDCYETFDQDTTMIHPTVYLDYPGNENGVWDPADIVFSNYDVQLIRAKNDEMMMEAHVPDWTGHEFKPVPPGDYYLRFMIPDDYTFIIMETGLDISDSKIDSDIISQDGYTVSFNIECHEQLTDIKAIIQKQ